MTNIGSWTGSLTEFCVTFNLGHKSENSKMWKLKTSFVHRILRLAKNEAMIMFCLIIFKWKIKVLS